MIQRRGFDKLFKTHEAHGALIGPWSVWLRHPEIGKAAAMLTKAVSALDALPTRAREIVIVTTGSHFCAAYELYAHCAVARSVGLDDRQVAALYASTRPEGLADEEALAFACTSALAEGGPQTLQHRSGRTGRAGRKGISMLLAPPASQRRADRLLAMAGLVAAWGGPPSVEEIRALDQRRLLADPILTGDASEDDLALGRRLLEGASAEKIAAALVRAYRARLPEPEDVSDPGTGHERPTIRDRKDPREDRAVARESGYDRNAATGNGGVRFRLDIGRKKNADPKWLLPMLCKREGITKRDIGSIRIFDRESKVEIAPRAAEAFAAAVAGPPPAGESIAIERTTAPGGLSAEGPRLKKRPQDTPRPKDEGAARRKRARLIVERGCSIVFANARFMLDRSDYPTASIPYLPNCSDSFDIFITSTS